MKSHFNCIEELLDRDWKYFINLCANDFPIKTSNEMAVGLKALYRNNRISSRPIKETETSRLNRYKYSWEIAMNDHPTPSDDYPMHQVNTGKNKTEVPYGMKLYAGSLYIVATRDFVNWTMTDSTAQKGIHGLTVSYNPLKNSELCC